MARDHGLLVSSLVTLSLHCRNMPKFKRRGDVSLCPFSILPQSYPNAVFVMSLSKASLKLESCLGPDEYIARSSPNWHAMSGA